MSRAEINSHPHARLLVCAKRLLCDRQPVTARWIVNRFDIGFAAARRDLRWLKMYLPVNIVDGAQGRGNETRLYMEAK